ncbi:N-acetyltransferase [Tateyamaria sp. syn59]|uniref:GNAT family N-acetyltransferase n=1 Tax=Tateyamaria sp. syn59 TaxID=2576942 RepID=UPI001678A12A|nr:GNAT family N-acetyltransferase [Tateyamaria sp. syn59]
MSAQQFENLLATLDAPDLGLLAPDGMALAALDHNRGQNPRMVGTVMAAERGDTAYLWGMYVAPDAIRRGIGTQLFNAVLTRISTSDISLVVLESSYAARAFYASLGFRANGSLSMDFGSGQELPAIKMTCPCYER